jgi:hypothetical protein
MRTLVFALLAATALFVSASAYAGGNSGAGHDSVWYCGGHGAC